MVAIYSKATIQDNVVKHIVATEIVGLYEGRLRPDMTASVSLQLEARNVMALPAMAVRRERGKHTVFVSVNGRPTPGEVKLGWSSASIPRCGPPGLNPSLPSDPSELGFVTLPGLCLPV